MADITIEEAEFTEAIKELEEDPIFEQMRQEIDAEFESLIQHLDMLEAEFGFDGLAVW